MANHSSACANLWHDSDEVEYDGEDDIDREFRRCLLGMRRLPRHERRGAYRAALEWKRAALAAYRERKAWERYGRRKWRQAQIMRPSPC